MKTEDLTGALLDYWVAKASPQCADITFEQRDDHIVGLIDIDGKKVVCLFIHGGDLFATMRLRRKYQMDQAMCYSPSKDWSQGGPLIEHEKIHLSPPDARVHRHGGPNAGWGESGVWTATTWHKGANGRRSVAWDEKSPLIAAMRCYVISKFGDEVPEDDRAAKVASHDTGGDAACD